MRLISGYTRNQLSQPFCKVQQTGQGAGQCGSFLQRVQSVPVGQGFFAQAKPLYSGRIQFEATHRDRLLARYDLVNLAGYRSGSPFRSGKDAD